MNYREYIKLVGYDKFHMIAEDWWDEKYVMEHMLDNTIERYALYGTMPFYRLNNKYNEEYKKNDDIGTTYDWLNEPPTEEEINEWKKENGMGISSDESS